MKKYKLLFLSALLMLPTIVYGQELAAEGITIMGALAMEAFVSIHMSIFVLKPLANLYSKDGDSKKLFWKLFFIRVAILLFFDFFITPMIAMVDFFGVFIGAFLVVPLSAWKNKDKIVHTVKTNNNISATTNASVKNAGVILKCTKCNSVITAKHKFCDNCGQAITGDNIKVEMDPNPKIEVTNAPVVKKEKFDSMFSMSEDGMVEEFIGRELTKAGMDKNTKLIPRDALKNKNILNIIFSVLVFIYITLIFFHFPLSTYLIGLIILFIFYKVTRGYNLIKYLKKQLKARPSEKVSNIVMHAKTTLTDDTSNRLFIPILLIAVVLPLFIFNKPVILYEKMDGGYGVRFYAFGITNFTTATIPEKHNGENVVSLRGNTFSNMPFLKEVKLPDTIVEIRGETFKNDKSLKKVNLPKNLMEIKGSTFENCSSLESIIIPDSVTRIGGHAFYGNSSLFSVVISENSKLREIGSSAFRRCDNLYEITIPEGVYINERAFKESPTDVRTYGMVNKLEYKNNRSFYMNIGERKKINDNIPNAIIQNEYVSLEKIIENNGLNEFTFEVSGQVFTLTSNYRKHEINSNLAIEINDDYVYKYYYDKVAFTVYYN